MSPAERRFVYLGITFPYFAVSLLSVSTDGLPPDDTSCVLK